MSLISNHSNDHNPIRKDIIIKKMITEQYFDELLSCLILVAVDFIVRDYINVKIRNRLTNVLRASLLLAS